MKTTIQQKNDLIANDQKSFNTLQNVQIHKPIFKYFQFSRLGFMDPSSVQFITV